MTVAIRAGDGGGMTFVTLDHSATVTSWYRAAEQLLGSSQEDAMEHGLCAGWAGASAASWVCLRRDSGISGDGQQGGWDARICSEELRGSCHGSEPACSGR